MPNNTWKYLMVDYDLMAWSYNDYYRTSQPYSALIVVIGKPEGGVEFEYVMGGSNAVRDVADTFEEAKLAVEAKAVQVIEELKRKEEAFNFVWKYNGLGSWYVKYAQTKEEIVLGIPHRIQADFDAEAGISFVHLRNGVGTTLSGLQGQGLLGAKRQVEDTIRRERAKRESAEDAPFAALCRIFDRYNKRGE